MSFGGVVLTGQATLDFPNTTAGTSSDLTISITGASVGDGVHLYLPAALINTDGDFIAWVSSADTVTVRLRNNNGLLGAAINPVSGIFRVKIHK